MTERIELTIPTDPDLRSVAGLVLGGVGSRLDLPYERLDDLQIAVTSTLEAVDGREVTLELEIDTDKMSVLVGPLERDLGADPALRHVLERLVDAIEERQRDGRAWVALHLARSPAHRTTS